MAPDRRREGIGGALPAWQEVRGRQHPAACDAALPGWLASGAHEHALPAIRLLKAHGYERARWWPELACDLDTPPAEPAAAVGIRVVPYGEEWREPARPALNDAFGDHWGTQPVAAAEWAAGDRLEAFRPDVSVLAVAPAVPDTSGTPDAPDTLDGERVVGFVFVDVPPDEWPLRGGPFGYITAVVLLTPAVASTLGPDDVRPVDEAALRERLAASDITLNGADNLFYLTTEARRTLPGEPDDASMCPLTDADAAAFARFEEAASEQDLDDAYVEPDHRAVHRAFDGDVLVAAASAYPWSDDAPLARDRPARHHPRPRPCNRRA